MIFQITSVPYITNLTNEAAHQGEVFQALIVFQYFAQMVILILTIFFLR